MADVPIYGERRYAMRCGSTRSAWRATGSPRRTSRTPSAATTWSCPPGIESQQREFSVTSQTNLVTAAQFAQIVVRTVNGFPVRLADVARVRRPASDRSRVRLNGREAISVGVIRQTTANPLELSDGVRAMLPILKADLPADVMVDIANDNSRFIDRSVKNVYTTILEAVLLVALVIFVFLRTCALPSFPSSPFPVSLIGGFALMQLAGFSINTLTLLALVLAIGLVVDDAIVMLENIYRHIEEGLDPFSAAIKGAEIGFAIVAMTLTLVAVYAPLAFTPGAPGGCLSSLRWRWRARWWCRVCGAHALAHDVLAAARHNPNPHWFDRFMERWLTRLSQAYGRLLRWLVTARWGRWLARCGVPGALAGAGVMALSGAGVALVYPQMRQELSPWRTAAPSWPASTRPMDRRSNTPTAMRWSWKIGRDYPEFDRIFASIGNPTVSQGSVVYRTVDWEDRKRSTLQLARGCSRASPICRGECLSDHPAVAGAGLSFAAAQLRDPDLGQLRRTERHGDPHARRHRPESRHPVARCGPAPEQA